MDFVGLLVRVFGGLAIFVYGMGLMSEGLTQIAGARLKAILAYITKNRHMAIAAGAGITAIIDYKATVGNSYDISERWL